MNFIIGRNNLALTIFVPFDCSNNCYFCTSKAGYRTNPPNLRKVKEAIIDFFTNYRYPITDVVFTGGERLTVVPESLPFGLDLGRYIRFHRHRKASFHHCGFIHYNQKRIFCKEAYTSSFTPPPVNGT